MPSLFLLYCLCILTAGLHITSYVCVPAVWPSQILAMAPGVWIGHATVNLTVPTERTPSSASGCARPTSLTYPILEQTLTDSVETAVNMCVLILYW